ncbi:hypothetical protein [Dyadobacter bucti]|uniref:hypothetical protein n=1 Tax=Dyadobacter bucti TaxID=2572203 RepID=UPI001108F73A|nr:hypothetical protein [Dyadobacter bucti]
MKIANNQEFSDAMELPADKIYASSAFSATTPSAGSEINSQRAFGIASFGSKTDRYVLPVFDGTIGKSFADG